MVKVMGERRAATYHIRRLSRALASLRASTPYTQEEIGERIGISFQTLSRIETGQLPSLLQLHALLDIYGILGDDFAPYDEMRALATKHYWWHGLGRKDVVYLSMEYEASRIRDFQAVHLPVLLQTDDYLQNLLETNTLAPSADRLAMELEAHQHRRKRLDGHPVTAHFLIYEPVLTTCLSVSQLAHLLRRSEQQHITIQIVPRQQRPVGILHNSFTTLSFPDKDEPDLVYTTTTIGPRHTQDAQDVATVNRTFRLLEKQAMTSADSILYIKKLMTGAIARSRASDL
jgi:transcriptional regulator with XRE-family HTH domain